jgi:predicted 3-demethylubiquinone-9 3-methyltransferase (glyoxalase superfamily)
MACGWLTDQFGVAWQITPRRLIELISDPDAAKAGRVMQAMMKMIKIDIATIEQAAAE